MEWYESLINFFIVVLPQLGEPWLSVVGGASIIASAVTKPKNKVGKVARRILDTVAFNFGNAKNADD